jgi:uncharacterized cupin superfamily protein
MRSQRRRSRAFAAPALDSRPRLGEHSGTGPPDEEETMIDERDGWFVMNVRDASWYQNASFGKVCNFEKRESPFTQTGVRICVLEPGKPNCRYHRESAQEDFLVLSGRCKLLVNGQERPLRAWDFVHCPPGTSHVFVGDGNQPCALLMIGHRPAKHELHYPALELARRYGAETPQPTDDPRVAYADVAKYEPLVHPSWPLEEDRNDA